MNGDKPGDAVADKWAEEFERNRREREKKLTRLEVRAEMKSRGEEEISEVITQRALEAQRKKDSEPPSKANPVVVVLAIVRKFPPWGAVIVAVVLGLAALGAYVVLRLQGIYK